MKPVKVYASDSCHWYGKDGTPQYEVERKDGKGMRNTRVTDARTMNLLPSVTTVMKQFAKDGVNEWILNHYLKYIQEHQITGCGMELYEFKSLLKKAIDPLMNQGRDEGTEIHKAVERYLTEGILEGTDKYKSIAEAVKNEITGYSESLLEYECEKSHANTRLGYGGAIDIRAFTLTMDELFIFDVKTTSEKQFEKLMKKPYTDWLCQLVAYEGFFNAEHRLVSVIVSRETGRVGSYEWADIKQNGAYWEKWKHALKIFKIDNKLV